MKKSFVIYLVILITLSGCIKEKASQPSNKPPFCSLTASPSSGYAPLTVNFTIVANDSDGYVRFLKMDFDGDGIYDYAASSSPFSYEFFDFVNYTYECAGTYVVNLTLEDNNGSFAYYTLTIEVYGEENKPPHADFSYTINNFTVSFKDLSYDEDGYIIGLIWDFGDGNFSCEKNPVHTYLKAGTYNVTFTVKDDKKISGKKSVTISIEQQYHKEWQPEYGVKYEVHVAEVIDGDTFYATLPNGSIGKIRLLGVDCPEKTESDNKPNEYDGITDLECLAFWGTQAKFFAEYWLEEKDVYIEFDNIAGFKGYYGRWLCYVYLPNGTDFNAELVKKGYARVYEEGECSKEDYYLALQQQAMENRTGLWSCMPEGGVVIVNVHYDAAGDDRYNLNDEYVVIKNERNASVNMTGWTLSDKANNVYTFPSGFVLDAGATVTVYTGSGNNTQDELYWGRHASPVWNNDHDTAYLKDANGNLADSWSW